MAYREPQLAMAYREPQLAMADREPQLTMAYREPQLAMADGEPQVAMADREPRTAKAYFFLGGQGRSGSSVALVLGLATQTRGIWPPQKKILGEVPL